MRAYYSPISAVLLPGVAVFGPALRAKSANSAAFEPPLGCCSAEGLHVISCCKEPPGFDTPTDDMADEEYGTPALDKNLLAGRALAVH